MVDDNNLVRDALEKMLSGWGLVVVTEDSAAGALARMQSEDFDAVLSDWRLPGERDGLQVLQQARRDTRARLTALLTGDNPAEVPPGFPVIGKPVRPLRLRALLQSSLAPDGSCDGRTGQSGQT